MLVLAGVCPGLGQLRVQLTHLVSEALTSPLRPLQLQLQALGALVCLHLLLRGGVMMRGVIIRPHTGPARNQLIQLGSSGINTEHA